MPKKTMQKKSCALMVGLVMTAGLSAQAEELPAQLEDILVTAQKQSQDIEQVPANVSVMTAADMQMLGTQNLDDISHWSPGTYFQSQAVTLPGYAIRGITSDNGSSLLQPRVSIYQNGVDISRHHGANTALYDEEQIEIVKGPQGTLFGRAAETGAVNIRQQLPKNETATEVQVGLGSLQDNMFTAVYNTPLVDDNVLARVAVYERKRDGYVDNRAGGTLGGIDTQAIRPSLSFIGEKQALDVVANVEKDTPSGTPFESVYFSPEAPDHANLEQGSQLGIERELWDVTAHYQHELANQWTLHSITAYREYQANEHFDADGSPYRLLDMEDIADHKQFSEDIRWQLDGERWDGFVGASMFSENTKRKNTVHYDEAAFLHLPVVQGYLRSLIPSSPIFAVWNPLSLQNPPAVASAWPFYLTNANVYEEQTQKGSNLSGDLFSDWTFHATSKLDLIAGLRASYEDVQSQITTPVSTSQSHTAAFLGATNLFFPNGGTAYAQQDHFWGWSGRMLANYKVDDSTAVYGGYSRGRRPDMLNYAATSAAQRLHEETVDAYETGVKWESRDKQQRAQASVFHYNYNHFLTSYFSNGNALMEKADDNGKAASNGVELQGESLLSNNWRVLGNLAYLDASIADNDKYAFAGNRFRLAPEWTGAVALVYTTAIHDYTVFAAPNYTFQSRVYFEDDNTSNFGNNKQDGYGLLNMHLGLMPQHKKWQADFYVDNVLNRDYLIDAGNFGGVLGMATTVPGAPRTCRIVGTWKF